MDSQGTETTAHGPPKLGTSAVFLTTISTILGAILFLRFGYAVANLGFLGTAALVVIGHLVTVPTALAISEIATNQRVRGGGVYYIISRSFGLNLGGAIGIALFFAQAISVAFYTIAFAQAFVPTFAYLQEVLGFHVSDSRWISVPTLLLLMLLMFTGGAAIGVRALYPVVGVIFVSLLCFFSGENALPLTPEHLVSTIDRPDEFFLVFATCFPAFTGLTAGVGLSGDLRDSRRAIPAGTLAAVDVEVVTLGEGESRRDVINRHSGSTDLTILGLRPEMVKRLGAGSFDDYEDLGAILFVSAQNGIDLDRVTDAPAAKSEADAATEDAIDQVAS